MKMLTIMMISVLMALLQVLQTYAEAAMTRPLLSPPQSKQQFMPLKSYGVTSDVKDAAWKTYDYVVVGGGLTGITVAARLAENPATTVLVIESGGDSRNDPRVYDIYKYTEAFNTEMDWHFPTDHKRNMTAGRTLGGGSSINGAAWTRGLAAQYDAWGSLLESSEASLNWNWNSLFTYMKKAETFSPPNETQKRKGADSARDYNGYSGPVQVTFPTAMYGGPQQPAFVQAIQKLTGIAHNPDLNGGNPNCVAYTPNNLNWRDHDHRSSAPAAYLTPMESIRTNWLTLVNHHVSNLLWATDNSKFAYGVQFKQTDNSGEFYQVYVKKEVIVAAGAIQTPALLQRSGVGDPALLSRLGINTVLNIPTVGKNLQEQTFIGLGTSTNGFDIGGSGPSDIIAFPNVYQLFGNQGNSMASYIQSNVNNWAASQQGNALSKQALQTIFQTQADLITKHNAPVVELFHVTGYPSRNEMGVILWPLLPFSRGNVQINSNNAFDKPSITINPFSADIDMTTQIASVKLVRQLFQTPPLSSLSRGESLPGFGRIPNGASDDVWKGWIWDSFVPVNHPIGTCAMMRQSLGGVVDGRLKVYGSKNVRIVDASVMPLQVSAHLSSTLYGIAEKAADMIKNGV